MLSLAILNLSDILESVSLYLLNSDLSLFEQDPFMLVSELFFSNIINSPYVRVVMVIVSKLDQPKKLQRTEI